MYVPCSGLKGENMVEPSSERELTQWYQGPTLIECVGKAQRAPVSCVCKVDLRSHSFRQVSAAKALLGKAIPMLCHRHF